MVQEFKVKCPEYYHLRSTVKHERFFAHVYFSNETVSQTTVSTGPMKMKEPKKEKKEPKLIKLIIMH